MPDYIVTSDCYVPVGEGDGLVFKRAGQRVTLATSEANKLVGFVKSANSFKVRKPKVEVEPEPAKPVTVQFLNTPPVADPEAVDDGEQQS